MVQKGTHGKGTRERDRRLDEPMKKKKENIVLEEKRASQGAH